MKIYTDYNGIGKIQYILGKSSAVTVNSEYTDRVVVEILIDKVFSEALIKEITEVTSGKAAIEILEECYCGVADGEIIVF